jgi:hypothetical protein
MEPCGKITGHRREQGKDAGSITGRLSQRAGQPSLAWAILRPARSFFRFLANRDSGEPHSPLRIHAPESRFDLGTVLTDFGWSSLPW